MKLNPQSLFVSILSSAMLLACGGSTGNVNSFHNSLMTQPGSLYSQACEKEINEFTSDVHAAKYIPPVFKVRSWRGKDVATGENQMPERDFIKLLIDGRVRSTLVEARSGLGKTKLIGSIKAQTCGKMPVFNFDLKSTILPAIGVKRDGENAITNEIARLLGQDETDGAVNKLSAGLQTGPFVLLLDAMDEVALYDREILVAEINAFLKVYPDTAQFILLSRPPVYENIFGLGDVDAWISIPPLQCDRTEERVKGARGGQAPVFWLLAEQVGVDRQVSRAGSCRFAHMSSYRDAHVVLDMAKRNAFEPNANGEYPKDQITRGFLYEYYARSFVDEIARAFSWSAAEALRIVDRIIAGQNPRPGVRAISFTVEECAKAVGVVDQKLAAGLCNDLVATKLFKRMGETFRFQPRNQSVTDYFLARWLDARAGTTVKVDCTELTSRAGIFESSEVVSFLVGMPNAQQCSVPIIETLCSQGAGVESTVDLLDQGLPSGSTRAELLDGAKTGLQGESARCFDQILSALNPSGD